MSRSMGRRTGMMFRGLSQGQSYIDKMIGYNPIAYWPYREVSGSQAKDVSGNDYHGGYTGVSLGQPGIGDGNPSPLFDGANDYVDIYSAAFNAAFNGNTGAIVSWAKVSGLGVLTDGIMRHMVTLQTGDNYFLIRRTTTDNTIQMIRRANSVNSIRNTYITDADWHHFAITWSLPADKVIVYVDGVQYGTVLTGLQAWSGNLLENWTNVGSYTEIPDRVWDGYIAHLAIFDAPLPATAISDLALV